MLTGIATGALGVLVGAMAAAWTRGHQVHRVERDRDRLESLHQEQTRLVTQLQRDRIVSANLALNLPTIVKELTRRDLNPRRVPRLILQLADAVFAPRQLLFYFARRNGQRRELMLACQQGLVDVPDAINRIPFGRGQIGWVAQHKVEMQRHEWKALEQREQQTVQANHPALNLDVIVPMFQPGSDAATEGRVLGVLCMGSPAHNRDTGVMLQLVTYLGTLALLNAGNVSALRRGAHHDGLTGLINKSFFQKTVADILLEAQRRGDPLAIFIFDVDHFKRYNDQNGHKAGDELLRRLAEVVRESCRPDDLVARFGGEEFIVAMPLTGAEDAVNVAERVRSAIEETDFDHGEKQPGGALTISGGVAVFPDDGASLDELVEHADQALYVSKRAGRNRVSRYRYEGLGAEDHDSFDPFAGSHVLAGEHLEDQLDRRIAGEASISDDIDEDEDDDELPPIDLGTDETADSVAAALDDSTADDPRGR